MITIAGPCIPKARPRVSIRGNKPFAYDTQESLKNATRLQMRSMYPNAPIQGPLSVSIECHLPVAKSIPISRANILYWKGHPISKPDIDNYAKFYLDCANGILWEDDSQITRLALHKRYSEFPKTIIHFSRIEPMALDEKTRKILEICSPVNFEALIASMRDIIRDIDCDVQCPLEGTAGLQSMDEHIRAAMYLGIMAQRYSATFAKVAKICDKNPYLDGTQYKEKLPPYRIGKPCC
jgi:Holliday junction resolvase RusA-like endonuclease